MADDLVTHVAAVATEPDHSISTLQWILVSVVVPACTGVGAAANWLFTRKDKRLDQEVGREDRERERLDKTNADQLTRHLQEIADCRSELSAARREAIEERHRANAAEQRVIALEFELLRTGRPPPGS